MGLCLDMVVRLSWCWLLLLLGSSVCSWWVTETHLPPTVCQRSMISHLVKVRYVVRIIHIPFDSSFCPFAELNILWAAHQVHHSSEYYNLSTALRQSLTQQCTSWVRSLALLAPFETSTQISHATYWLWISSNEVMHWQIYFSQMILSCFFT